MHPTNNDAHAEFSAVRCCRNYAWLINMMTARMTTIALPFRSSAEGMARDFDRLIFFVIAVRKKMLRQNAGRLCHS